MVNKNENLTEFSLNSWLSSVYCLVCAIGYDYGASLGGEIDEFKEERHILTE